MILPALIFSGAESPAHLRGDAQYVEIVGRDGRRAQRLRFVRLRPTRGAVTTAMRSGWRPGGRLIKIALTMLNIVELMPMPNARVTTAIAVNPGFFTNCLMP